jgi:solute carrier family 13 (sodium-dependent dicarboxylate transporter), member 2/3/5
MEEDFNEQVPILGWRRAAGLAMIPLMIGVMLVVPAPAGLAVEGWRVACVAVMMAALWISEAIPIPATALLPLVLLPLAGVTTVEDAAAPYANPVIYLFMGGFLLSLSMQRWGLHRRIALGILGRVGSRPRSILAGFMLASALLSMWISNAATTLMMLPIALSISQLLKQVDEKAVAQFAPPLMLALAYASSIGGLGTPIGTPPNAFLVGHMQKEFGIELSFAQFMLMGVPLMLVALPLVYWLLTRVCFKVPSLEVAGAQETILREKSQLGRMSRGEAITAVVFASAALLWVVRPLLAKALPVFGQLGDAGVAMLAGLLLFILPVNWRRGEFVMNWEHGKRVPWDVLILFGGGLTLARQIETTGLADWLGAQASPLAALPIWLTVLTVCLVITFLTELTSNTATAAALVPVAASLSVGMGHSPLLLALPVCLSASCAFMLPVATPPNAVVFGSGMVNLNQMARTGFWLNLIMVVVLTVAALTLAPLIFGPQN